MTTDTFCIIGVHVSTHGGICFFDPEFNHKEIEKCAKMAAVHNDIMAMPMSYNSLIGQ